MPPVLAASLVAAASAVLVAPAPSYDPWAWLLWGREVASGTLSTAEGPAFKPLPVAVCALLAPLGDGAPVAWVVLVRAAAVLAAWLAFRLARRLAGGSAVAGLLGAAGLLLCGALPVYAITGAETPLLLVLVLAGAEAWRAGRPGAALGCGVGCALLRVEAWPFLAGVAVLAWRRGALSAGGLAALAAAVPAAWLVPEWVASGDVLRSGSRAMVPNAGQPALADVPALASLGEAVALPLWPLAIAAVAGAVAWRGELGAWAAAGATWVLLVAAMAQAGFSGEPRYALPGAALIAVAGAAGLARLGARLPGPAAAAAAGLVLVAVAAAPRVAALERLPAAQAHQWALATRLDDAIRLAGGRDPTLACGRPHVGPLRGPLLAYALRVPKAAVEPDAPPRTPAVIFRSRRTPSAPAEPSLPPGFADLGRAGPWSVHRACARVAGVEEGRPTPVVRVP